MRFQRRANTLSPELSRELLDAYRTLRESLTDAETARLIASGQLDRIIDQALLDKTFVPLRDKILAATKRGFESGVKDLPRSAQFSAAFDTLNPRVIDAVRQLDTRVLQTLKGDIRDTARAFIENGLRDGSAPKSIARDLRSVIGMSPTQAENAQKYEAKLRALVRKPLTEEQIGKRVAVYQRKAIAFNAEVNARTATLDSLKLGQKLSWDDAIAQGIVDPNTLWKRWSGVMDARERLSHVAMQGEEAPYNQPYSNGQMVPGDTEFNCRCISVFFVKRSSVSLAA